MIEARSFQGQLEASEAHRVVAPAVWGLTVSWIVEEGTRVEAGDTVVRLDTKDFERNRRDLVSQLEVVDAKLGQQSAQRQLARAAATRRVDEVSLDLHLADLRTSESPVVPLFERERARVDHELATLDLAGAQDAVQLAELDGAAEMELLELEARDLRARLESVDREIEACTLTAPGPGVAVLAPSRRGKVAAVGERIWMGETLVELPDLDTMAVAGWVHEVDSPGIVEGSRAQVRMDAHPDDVFPASVTAMAPLAVPRGEHGLKQVGVTLEFDAVDPRMKPGMTVTVDVEVRRAEGAVTVPDAALQNGPDGPFVWVSDGGWTTKPVVVLARDDHQAAVEGVDEGDTVALATPAVD